MLHLAIRAGAESVPETGVRPTVEKKTMGHRALMLLACLFLATSVPVAAQAQSASDLEARARALGTTIDLANVPHPDQGVEWGRAEGVVEASPADVLAIVYDYAQYAGIFPYFEKSRVLSQRGNDAIVYLEAKVLHGAATLWSQVRMTARSPTPNTRVIEARMMKGKGNIGQLLARWEVTPVDGGQKTFVRFQLLVDPDLPMPDLVISSEMKKGAGQAFRALRTRVAQRVYASRSNNRM
jgi:ribosome-associated toxin RatA of RatAB toxin-antitoxin module